MTYDFVIGADHGISSIVETPWPAEEYAFVIVGEHAHIFCLIYIKTPLLDDFR